MNLDNWVNFFKLSILCTHLLVVTTVMSMYFVAYMFFFFKKGNLYKILVCCP